MVPTQVADANVVHTEVFNTEIERLMDQAPQYRPALAFYRRLLAFQAELRNRFEPQFQLTREVAEARWRHGWPLLAGECLHIEPSVFRDALSQLRQILEDGPVAPELRAALDAWLAAGLPGTAALSELPTRFVADGSGCVEALAGRTGIEVHALQFVLETVLSPYLEKAASGFREQLSQTAWQRGVCPICGSEPYMARLAQEDGRRLLACRLCNTEWPFPRLSCPFCPHSTPGTLTYFQVEGDDAHRVDCCPACRRYIKTTDERTLGRPAVLPIEDIVTAHLDDLAEEQGYS